MDLHADIRHMTEEVRKKNDHVILGGDATEPPLYAYWLGAGMSVLIPTGIAIQVPEGYEAQIRSRSGLALKKGVVVLNSPGTIDSDYRGEVGVVLFNTSNETVTIYHEDRIAQLVITPVVQPIIEEVAHLSETKRGEGGFGSTGTK